MPRIESKPRVLECNNCGYRFEHPWPHKAVESNEGIAGWEPVEDNVTGVTCPSCGSARINPEPQGSPGR